MAFRIVVGECVVAEKTWDSSRVCVRRKQEETFSFEVVADVVIDIKEHVVLQSFVSDRISQHARKTLATLATLA